MRPEIELTTRENERHEWNDEGVVTKTWTETEPIYKVACGQEYPVEYWDEPRLRVEHTSKCRACAVLTGRSKAVVMTQDDVAKLFALGIDGKHSGGGRMGYHGVRDTNYESEDGILLHYGTIEGVRLLDGKVVANTQCWSAGFAHCSLRSNDYQLPLTTIRGEIGSTGDLRAIDVLDVKEGTRWSENTLFRHNDRYFLYGWDERAPFLVELSRPAVSVEDALESLKPAQVQAAEKLGVPVLRQGDLFFVPVEKPGDEQMDDIPLRARFKQNAVTKFERRLVRPKIFGTNHTAGELASISTCPTILGTGRMTGEFGDGANCGTIVRGTIQHQPEFRGPDHAKLPLGKQWHAVFENTAKQSITVPRRGGSGGVD